MNSSRKPGAKRQNESRDPDNKTVTGKQKTNENRDPETGKQTGTREWKNKFEKAKTGGETL